uniref:snRNA-activating protein complex subunit 3 n=1 Tax=Lygus hesperus TaxID=30085 RepID=A0A0A9YWM2_LYGHE
MRSNRAIRLSDPIVSWVYENDRYLHSPHLFPYTQRAMESTTFSELRIRLGSHYLYQHQGSCQHTLIFTEMRVKSSDDFDDVALYVCVVLVSPVPPPTCMCVRAQLTGTHSAYFNANTLFKSVRCAKPSSLRL